MTKCWMLSVSVIPDTFLAFIFNCCKEILYQESTEEQDKSPLSYYRYMYFISTSKRNCLFWPKAIGEKCPSATQSALVLLGQNQRPWVTQGSDLSCLTGTSHTINIRLIMKGVLCWGGGPPAWAPLPSPEDRFPVDGDYHASLGWV